MLARFIVKVVVDFTGYAFPVWPTRCLPPSPSLASPSH